MVNTLLDEKMKRRKRDKKVVECDRVGGAEGRPERLILGRGEEAVADLANRVVTSGAEA